MDGLFAEFQHLSGASIRHGLNLGGDRDSDRRGAITP